MSEEEMIDHLYTDEVVCPYCGHKYMPDMADSHPDGDEEECEECGLPFTATTEYSYSFVTERTDVALEREVRSLERLIANYQSPEFTYKGDTPERLEERRVRFVEDRDKKAARLAEIREKVAAAGVVKGEV